MMKGYAGAPRSSVENQMDMMKWLAHHPAPVSTPCGFAEFVRQVKSLVRP